MIFAILLITVCTIIVIVYACLKSESEKDLQKKIEEIRLMYPLAYKQHFCDCDISKAKHSVLKKIVERPQKMWETEEQKLQKQEQQRKEIECQFNRITNLYLEGFKKYKQQNPCWSKKQVVSEELKIRNYDKSIKESKAYDEWEKEQGEFKNKCLEIGKQTMASFGWYRYDIPFQKKDESDRLVPGEYEVWQFFAGAYCLETDLDYSEYKNIKEKTENLNEFKNCERNYKSSVFEKILDFIEHLTNGYGEVSIYLCANNKEWDAQSLTYHYADITTIFNDRSDNMEVCNPALKTMQNNIPLDHDYYPRLKNRHIIIIDMQTENWQLKEVCKNLIEKNKASHPLITYISMLKGFDRVEMQELIDREKRKKAEAEEQKRKEREEEERRKAELAKYKSDKSDIISLLDNNLIDCFYHFTAVENLEYIKKYGGLYSWYYLEYNDMQVPFIGGSGNSPSHSLDKRYGLQDYVRLSFCDDHPMQYRHKQNGVSLVLLQIATEVATWRETLFSDINATDRGHQCGGTYKDLQRVDFSAVKKHYVSREDPDFKLHQAEILVKTFIPINFIVNIDNPIKLC